MKIKLAEIEPSVNALSMLASLNLPPVAAFKIARIMRATSQPLQDYTVQKDRVLREHGKLVDKENSRYVIDMDLWKEHGQPLLEVEVDIPVEPLKIGDFGHANLPPIALAALTWCITLD